MKTSTTDGPAGRTAEEVEEMSEHFPSAPPVTRIRRARLKVASVDPWSVTRLAFLLSIGIAIMTVVATVVLWAVLDLLGVFSSVGSTVGDVTGDGDGGFDLESYFSLTRVLGWATIMAVFDVILLTGLAAIGAYLYNLAADSVGGIEVTLAEEE